MKQYDFLVFIGRFQPFHLGHLSVIESGLAQSHQMIILCGSAHQPRSSRNPWTIAERETMMRGALDSEKNQRLHFAPLMDVVYNDESWVRNVQTTVNGIVTAQHGIPHKVPKIGLIGHSKDHSSYYLNLFPQWGAVEADNHNGLSATDLRKKLFCADEEKVKSFLKSDHADSSFSENVKRYLEEFTEKQEFDYLKREYDFIEKYKSAWNSAPYAPTFVTVDAIVIQSGHVLMVKRKASPGSGLLALPGGFVNQTERLVDACLRELREETRLKVPLPVLKGSIKRQEVFDDPFRSARGRTITHAFFIELTPNSELPKVRGSDDAEQAMWLPLADLDPSQIFDDHYFIIQEMIGF